MSLRQRKQLMEEGPVSSPRPRFMGPRFMGRIGTGVSTMSTRALGLVSLLIVLAACGGGGTDLVGKAGRNLEVIAAPPEVVDKVAFVDGEGRNLVIRPRATNRQLALVNVILINRLTTVIPLIIDTEAAQLGDRRGERIDALDPFEAARVADGPDPEQGKYLPFVWGEVPLERNTQVSGWMVFDVPKGLILGSLWWEEVDGIIVDFIDYRRE